MDTNFLAFNVSVRQCWNSVFTFISHWYLKTKKIRNGGKCGTLIQTETAISVGKNLFFLLHTLIIAVLPSKIL